MLTAYFDESGHSATLGFFALAALVAPSESWPLFDAEWQRVLGECDAPYLHMREFAHRLGPYEAWPEERRRALLSGCVSAIKATRAVAVGAVLDVADFNSLSDGDRVRLQDPFFCCFQEVVRGAAISGVFEDSDVKVNMVFSTQDEFCGRASSLYEAMLRSIDVRNRIGGLAFEDMRDRPALQAADLVAYELRQHYQLGREEPPRPTRWAFREIVEHQRHTLGAQRLKYLPRWYLNAQAELDYDSVMTDILARPDGGVSLLSELTPTLR
jgi:hypothetical protein